MRFDLALVLAAVALFAFPAFGQSDTQPPTPEIANVTPAAAPPGATVTIHGNNFLPGARVTLGGAEARVQRVGSTEIVATVGPHPPGRVSVEVRNPDDQVGVRGWSFTYQAPAGGTPARSR